MWLPPAGSMGEGIRALSVCLYKTLDSTLRNPWIFLDPDHHMAKDTGNSFVLPVKVFNDKDSFSFLMWVAGGAKG